MVAQKFVQVGTLSRALLGCVLSALFAAPVLAGDVIGDVTEPDVIAPKTDAWDYGGFYLGASAGYGFGGTDDFGLTTATDRFPIGELELSGGYGGLRGGWRNSLPTIGGRDYVFGFELGYDFGTLDDSVSSPVGSTTIDAGSSVSDVLSIRFRNGITNRSRSILYFVSFGYASADVTTSLDLDSGLSSRSFEDSGNRGGFTASLGLEHWINENWSITGEYEYFQFDSETIDFGSGFSTKSTPKYQGVRVGLNYSF